MSVSDTAPKKEIPQYYFPTQLFLPARSGSSESGVKESTVQATHFANLFREWMRNNRVGYDATTHANLEETCQAYIERMAASVMVAKDIDTSIKTTGVRISMDTQQLLSRTNQLMELWLFKKLVGVFELSDYQDDLVAIEISRMFGTQTALLKRKQRKQEEKEAWLRNTASGIHSMLREIASTLKRKGPANLPEAVDPQMRKKALSELLAAVKATDQTPTQIPGPS